MKKINLCLLMTIFATASSYNLLSKTEKPMGANPYTYAPLYFTAYDKTQGSYWPGNKKYPGKAFVGEDEYMFVIAIPQEEAILKSSNAKKKNKVEIGFYKDGETNIKHILYGKLKYPERKSNEPDADVLTKIAIDLDYGPGE